jgi:uncharacterized membrane protein YoaK (UPF0700 family)
MPPSDTSIQPSLILDAMLLATTGGLLDAFVYLNHGRVFANAMTGNVIFLGIAAVGRNWGEIIPYLVPLGGFFAGVLTSKHMRSRLGPRSVLLGLALEILTLFALSWLPSSFPNMGFTACIAYVAAFQVSSFRRVNSFPYNSTFLTGNLRDMTEGIYDTITGSPDKPAEHEKSVAQARDLGLVCLCFLIGATLGAWASPRFGNHTLWFTEPFLLTVILRTARRGSSGQSRMPSPSSS